MIIVKAELLLCIFMLLLYLCSRVDPLNWPGFKVINGICDNSGAVIIYQLRVLGILVGRNLLRSLYGGFGTIFKVWFGWEDKV